MGKVGITEFLIAIAVLLVFFFIIRAIILWYYKIDERITQQHETNRLLRKLAGEPEIESGYITAARNKVKPTVSNKLSAEAPIKHNGLYITGND